MARDATAPIQTVYNPSIEAHQEYANYRCMEVSYAAVVTIKEEVLATMQLDSVQNFTIQ